jgi:hypothetical protein
VETVVEDLQRLENVAPILSLVIEPLVKHIHYVVEFGGPAIGLKVSLTLWSQLVQSVTYVLKVIWAISLICVPVGPHGSLLVAVKRSCH